MKILQPISFTSLTKNIKQIIWLLLCLNGLSISLLCQPTNAKQLPSKLPTTATQGAEQVRTGITTWYSHASTLREGCSGIMANGRRMDDTALTAASWDYPLGTQIRVGSVYGKTVVVTVTDRGPAKRLYRQGKILDLSPAAFDALGFRRGCTAKGVCWGEGEVTITSTTQEDK